MKSHVNNIVHHLHGDVRLQIRGLEFLSEEITIIWKPFLIYLQLSWQEMNWN